MASVVTGRSLSRMGKRDQGVYTRSQRGSLRGRAPPRCGIRAPRPRGGTRGLATSVTNTDFTPTSICVPGAGSSTSWTNPARPSTSAICPAGMKLTQGEGAFRTVEFDRARQEQDATREVAPHPLEACPGTVDANDAEVFGADALDAWLEDPVGLVNGDDKSPPPTTARTLGCHENHLREKGEHSSPCSSKAAGTPIS